MENLGQIDGVINDSVMLMIYKVSIYQNINILVKFEI